MNDAVKGWLMLAPTLFFMFIFTVWPILKSAYLGLTAFEIGMPKPQFIGLHNYIEFAKSELFWKVMRNTLYFSVLTVVPAFIIGLMLAMLVNKKNMKFIGFFRTSFFIPLLCR